MKGYYYPSQTQRELLRHLAEAGLAHVLQIPERSLSDFRREGFVADALPAPDFVRITRKGRAVVR